MTESKLDHTIPDSEVNLPGYDILECDRNRNGSGETIYYRSFPQTFRPGPILEEKCIRLSDAAA